MLDEASKGRYPEKPKELYTNTLHVREKGLGTYRPNVKQGYVSTTPGPDYGRCVPKLVRQAGRIYYGNGYDIKYNGTVNVPSTLGEARSQHNQGFVSFRDEVNKNTGLRRTRVAMTQNGNAGTECGAQSEATYH